LVIAHRRGYGQALPASGDTFTTDVADVLALLEDGGHLVGYSYGGVVALVAAGRRPDLVRSIAVIEPPAFGIVEHPAVTKMIQRLAALQPASRFTPEEFRAGFLRALNSLPPDPLRLTREERQSVLAAMVELPPWEAPIDLPAIAAAPFPKLIFSGNWDPAFEAVADALEHRLGAQRSVISGAGHAVQDTGDPFNRRLLAFWRAADKASGVG
jgi:pimeloyl-ACP methyl ester carboxylesterase